MATNFAQPEKSATLFEMLTQESTKPVLNPRFVATALALPLSDKQGADQPFTAVVTDSRKIVTGCLFVALKGEKFDGHDFIESAIQQGTRAILYRQGFNPDLAKKHPHVIFFGVPDSQEGFRALSGAWRRRFSIPVVVIAGANGKTTTKELLAAILTAKFPEVLKTRGSQNGYLGIPMTLLDLKATHGAAVVEVGIDEIGAMDQHLKIVEPTASVVTVIGPEHLKNLRDVATVAREESIALTRVAASGGIVAINLDDPWLGPLAKSISGRKLGFGLGPSQGDGLKDVVSGKLTDEGTSLEVNGFGFSNFSVKLPLLGKHNAANLLAALALARALDLSPEEIRRGLSTFKGADGRSELRMLGGGTPVVCDYYNASPLSMAAGLDLLEQVATSAGGKRRVRWACLADMLELGPDEETFHRALADPLCALKIENVFLYGPRMKWLHDELMKRKFAGRLEYCQSHQEMAAALNSSLGKNDALLIKGSRGMRMEEVWKLLR